MPEKVADTAFSAGGVLSDSRYYAGAVEALRSACAHIGEAADSAQRSGFFSDVAGLNDEARASAHDADRAAVMAMAEALRAKESVSEYAEAARWTLSEATKAFSVTASPVTPTDVGADAGAGTAGDSSGSEAGTNRASFSGHLSDALVALTAEAEPEAGKSEDEGYVKLAQTLSVLAGARNSYRAVDEALILMANARNAYLKQFDAAERTVLAADLKAAVADDIRANAIGDFRSAMTELSVTRTAYNAEVAEELWGALAEARINLAAATTTVLEIQATVGGLVAGDGQVDGDKVHAASALAYSLGGDGAPTEVYDAALDVVIEAREYLRRAQSACDAVDSLLLEKRAVAADALVEARASVGSAALVDMRAAYDTVSDAMDALFGARAAFEVGFEFTLPEIFTTADY